jgi:hypothetical protein
MSQQEVVYHLNKYDSNEAAYQALCQSISEIADNLQQNVYTVIWESENHNHDSRYEVVDTREVLNETVLRIEGQQRGGTYELFPKSNDPPIVRYCHPDGEIGWEEKALGLIITSGDFAFEYDPEEDRASFFEYVREQIGL